MIVYYDLVQQLIDIFEESKKNNYPEFILRYELDKFINEQLRYSSGELEEAYQDGKNAYDEEQYDSGYEDGYNECKDDILSSVKEKIHSLMDEFKEKTDSLFE